MPPITKKDQKQSLIDASKGIYPQEDIWGNLKKAVSFPPHSNGMEPPRVPSQVVEAPDAFTSAAQDTGMAMATPEQKVEALKAALVAKQAAIQKAAQQAPTSNINPEEISQMTEREQMMTPEELERWRMLKGSMGK